MTDLEIRYFLEIVNQGVSFTKASQTLYISQPALTKHISGLSKSLGVKLINTSNKSAPVLTPEGRLFYHFFTEYSEKFEKVLLEAKHIKSKELSFAGITHWDNGTLLSLKNKLARIHPEINISLVTCGFKELQNGFLDDQYDLVFTLTDQLRGIPNTTMHEYYRGQWLLAFSSSHPLAEKADDGTLLITDFKNDIFYMIDRYKTPFIWENVDMYFRSLGFAPKYKYYPDLNNIIINLQQGDGCSVFTDLVYMRDYHSLKYIPLDLFFSVSFFWKNNNTNEALQLFLETCLFDKNCIETA